MTAARRRCSIDRSGSLAVSSTTKISPSDQAGPDARASQVRRRLPGDVAGGALPAPLRPNPDPASGPRALRGVRRTPLPKRCHDRFRRYPSASVPRTHHRTGHESEGRDGCMRECRECPPEAISSSRGRGAHHKNARWSTAPRSGALSAQFGVMGTSTQRKMVTSARRTGEVRVEQTPVRGIKIQP